MDKYKRLATNTFTFALGTLGSKLLVFLLMPFYTRVLSTESYGIVDILVQTCNFLIPIATIGIINAVIRFGLEKKIDKKDVFSIGFFTILIGFGIMLLLYPLLDSVKFIKGYTIYIYLFIFMSSMQGLSSQFVRTIGYVKLYAINGIFSTALTIIFNILFLGVLKYGIVGYILSTILTDFISTVLLIFIARLYDYVSISSFKKALAAQMLKYSIPLIPNTVCTWIINISDRYLITYMIGCSANGIYAIANKIPTILIIVANIFSDAWQISSVNEDKMSREHFFTRVAGVYQAIAFTTASLLISTAKISTKLLTSSQFYESWQYIPFLVMATTFACLASFLSSVYMVEKKSVYTLTTTFICATSNIMLNLFLIPVYSIYGAAISTFLCYFILFVIRLIHTRKFIKIHWNIAKLILNSLIIFVQSIVIVKECNHWIIWLCILCVCTVVINFKSLIKIKNIV